MIDIGIKAANSDTALQFFVGLGLLAIIPADKDGPESLFWEPGVAYDDCPISIVVKPAVFDDKTGELISEAEIDPNYHANIRLYGRVPRSLLPKSRRVARSGPILHSPRPATSKLPRPRPFATALSQA